MVCDAIILFSWVVQGNNAYSAASGIIRLQIWHLAVVSANRSLWNFVSTDLKNSLSTPLLSEIVRLKYLQDFTI